MKSNGKLQAKDLSDTQFMKSVLKHGLADYYERGWDKSPLLRETHPFVMRWEIEADFPQLPWKVLLAKASALMRRGFLDGCACGCRGDYRVIF